MNDETKKNEPESPEPIVRLNFALEGAAAVAFEQFIIARHLQHNSVTARMIIMERLTAEGLYTPSVVLPVAEAAA